MTVSGGTGVLGGVRAVGGEGRAAGPWLRDAAACVVQGQSGTGVMNEHVVTWERAGTNS